MANVTPPKAQIPIATFWMGGKEIACAVHPEWLRFLTQSVVERIGGIQGIGSTDLAISQFEDAGIEETKAQLSQVFAEFSQLPPVVPLEQVVNEHGRIEALEAQVAAIQRVIDGIQQGLYA